MAPASGQYVRVGRLIFIQTSINITNVGTGTGFVRATPPFAAHNGGVDAVLQGDLTTNGHAVYGNVLQGISQVDIFKYDSSTPIAVTLSGIGNLYGDGLTCPIQLTKHEVSLEVRD
jgi:hypothetical protein